MKPVEYFKRSILKSIYDSIEWLGTDDTGISSKTLLYTALGIELSHTGYPNDPADLGRCIRMLEKLPWVRERAFEILSAANPIWAGLIDEWDTLAELYFKELPTGFAPLTFDRMKEIQNRGKK